MFCISELVHNYIYVFGVGDKLQFLLYTALNDKYVVCFTAGTNLISIRWVFMFEPAIVVSTSNLFGTIHFFVYLYAVYLKCQIRTRHFEGGFSSSIRVSLHIRGGSMLASQPGGFLSQQVFSLPLTFRRRIESRLPFAGIIRRLPYSTRFQDKG